MVIRHLANSKNKGTMSLKLAYLKKKKKIGYTALSESQACRFLKFS